MDLSHSILNFNIFNTVKGCMTLSCFFTPRSILKGPYRQMALALCAQLFSERWVGGQSFRESKDYIRIATVQ